MEVGRAPGPVLKHCISGPGAIVNEAVAQDGNGGVVAFDSRVAYHEFRILWKHGHIDPEYVASASGVPYGTPLVFPLVVVSTQFVIGLSIVVSSPDESPVVYVDISPRLVQPGFCARWIRWYTIVVAGGPDFAVRIRTGLDINTRVLDDGYVLEILVVGVNAFGKVLVDNVKLDCVRRIVKAILGVVVLEGVV